jgi:MATE family multidrug resistance protein
MSPFEECQLLAPLWQQPTRKKRDHHLDLKRENEIQHLEYYEDFDISSLALAFVPFPFTSGGATYTMDAPEARRFSTSTAERVGLLKTHDNAAKQHQYGTIPDPAEIESLMEGDGTTEELGTTAGQEAKLLLKYSLPLMGTYLLQYSFSLVTIFVVGHSKINDKRPQERTVDSILQSALMSLEPYL